MTRLHPFPHDAGNISSKSYGSTRLRMRSKGTARTGRTKPSLIGPETSTQHVSACSGFGAFPCRMRLLPALLGTVIVFNSTWPKYSYSALCLGRPPFPSQPAGMHQCDTIRCGTHSCLASGLHSHTTHPVAANRGYATAVSAAMPDDVDAIAATHHIRTARVRACAHRRKRALASERVTTCCCWCGSFWNTLSLGQLRVVLVGCVY